MQEVLVNSKMVVPSVSHVRRRSWEEVQECADLKLRHLLPPVILIEMVDHNLVFGKNLFDGNHRVLLTEAYGGFVRGLLYTVKEVMAINGKEHSLYITAMDATREGMRRANKYGVYNWKDLLNSIK